MFVEEKDLRSETHRFVYTPRYRGQANYILKECEQRNIKAFYCNGELCIRSQRKVEAFERIILISLKKRCDVREFPTGNFIYKKGRSIIGVWNSKTQILHIPAEKIDSLKYYEYLGKIPFFPFLHLHNSLHEMKEYLEMEDKILI